MHRDNVNPSPVASSAVNSSVAALLLNMPVPDLHTGLERQQVIDATIWIWKYMRQHNL